jgi:hypothetical protein
MDYQLPPELDQRIQTQLALGIYALPADVLSDALDQRNGDLASIQRGIEDERAGRVISFRQFDKRVRSEFSIAPHK